MKKQIKDLGRVLTTTEQKKILAGGSEPIDGGGTGGGGNGGTNIGVCIENGRVFYVPCDSLCSNGTDPICAA